MADGLGGLAGDGALALTDALAVVPPSLRRNHKFVSSLIRGLEKDGELSTAVPAFDADRARNLAKYASEFERFEDHKLDFKELVENNSRSIVDESQEQTAQARYEMGYTPTITRTTLGETCDWCNGLAGTREYNPQTMSRDIFARHRNCDCLIELNRNGGTEVVNNYSRGNTDTSRRSTRNRNRDIETALDRMSRKHYHESELFPATGKKISREELVKIIDYANERGIKLVSFENFDGDVSVLRDFIDSTEKVTKDFPELLQQRNGFQIHNDYRMNDDDYAYTKNGKIHINNNIMRNRSALEQDYAKKEQEGWFAKGTNYKSIPCHECGHAVYQSLKLSPDKLIGDLQGRNISEYGGYSAGEGIAEAFNSHYNGVRNNTAERIWDRCLETVKERRRSK